MNDTDAVRLRELQHRLYAPGGELTPEEADELRTLQTQTMTSAAAASPTPAAVPGPESAEHARPEPAEHARTEPGVAGETSPPTAATSAGAPARSASEDASAEQDATPPASRRRRWAVAGVLAASLAVGLGIGWITSPHTTHAVPEMTAAQQKQQRDIIASGDVDAGTLAFEGVQDGAAVWTARKGDEKCVVLTFDGQRSVACADPERGSYGTGAITTALQGDRDGTHTAVTALAVKALSGRWTVIVDTWESDPDDTLWQQQYSAAEMRLIGALQDAGYDGQDLMILGHDGDLPIWGDLTVKRCVAVVDPDTLDVSQACEADDSVDVVDLPYKDAVYSVRWSDERGAALTIFRDPKGASRVSCDTDTGECASIDDKTGDVG